MAIKKTIRLYGQLGARFGRVHKLNVQSPAEAVKALCVMIDGFENYMLTSRSKGMVFAVLKGKHHVAQSDLAINSGEFDIRIAPVMVGAKKAGLFQVIVGAVLVVAGAVATYFGGGAVGVPMMKFGAMLMLGGVVQMLAPQPKGLKTRQDPDNTPSYAFGGPVNSTALGNPVAILWGEREIGGNIISAGIIANEVRN